MTILSVAYPLLAVSADSAGGAEQILHSVEAGLVKAGHRSVVIAAEGSEVAGELVRTRAAEGEITEKVRSEAQREQRAAIEGVLRSRPIDCIHFHGLDFSAYLPDGGVRKLATLHLPLDWYPRSIFAWPGLQVNCVSRSQAATHAGEAVLPVVANGIDVDRYRAGGSRGNYVLWLGRICPEKGVDLALKVARQAGLPALIAGPVHAFHDHQVYFAERVAPLLDADRRYVGPVGLQEKAELLRNAKCLLVPSLVAETSSLVAMEALSSGTPVVALRAGALPEVVEHGKTGFIVDSAEEMAAMIAQVDRISTEACREAAVERFSAARMVGEYLKLYERLGS